VGFHWHYLILTIILLIPTTLTATLGTIHLSAADEIAITRFWPAAALQIVLSIWFGFYGVLAGIIGPMLGNGLVGESPFLFIPANTFYCCLAGLWFRYFKLDPRLRSRRDWVGLLLVCCLGGNAIGGGLGVFESILRNSTTAGADWNFWAGKFFNWITGNTLPSLILAPALLKAASPIIVRGPFFCQRFFGGVTSQVQLLRYRFNDLPMIAKLMLLILLAGILPLSVVATWSVITTVRNADALAAVVNREAARQLRNEIERHELQLRLWASQLSRADLSDADRARQLAQWQKLPDSFADLKIVDLSQAQTAMPANFRKDFESRRIAFFPTEIRNVHQVDFFGIAKLPSMPEKAIIGQVVWRGDGPFTGRWAAVEGIIVLDQHGQELYRDCPNALNGWTPSPQNGHDTQFLIRYGGQTWNVAEADIPRLGWHFLALSSVKSGQAVILANVPNPVAILTNLAIFGSLIIGSFMTRRISDRVLTIADHVRLHGAEPGQLKIPIRGQDELGFLGVTLNRMSSDLADYVQRLQETLAEKERLAAEMELAREVQQAILPDTPPRIPGYDIAALSNPAREVGGDFFDFIPTADGRMVFMIGDAVGKGLRAAMYVSETHGLAHSAALEYDTPDKILAAVNAAIVASRGESSDFVTLFCAVLDPKQHKLLYASAGHNPPVWKHQNRVQSFEFGSLPLAVMEDSEYQLHQIDLASGDTVIMYTDGVTESLSEEKELFGNERLEALLSELNSASAEETNRTVLHAVEEFVRQAPQSDDLTLLTLRRR
jgi:serine phosphatase RsbU (regulator of sigma subunit)